MSYTDLESIEQELRVSAGSINSTTSPTDAKVYDWIAQAVDKINTKTGNIYSQQLVSSQVLDWKDNDNILRIPPFTTITSLEYNDQAAGDTPIWTAKTEDTDFYTYPQNGEIEFISSNFSPLSGKKRFRLTYFKGQSKVPNRIKQLATMIVANRVVSATVANQAAEQSGGSVQVGTIKIEDPTAFSVGAYKARDMEVKAFMDEDIGTFKSFRIDREYDV